MVPLVSIRTATPGRVGGATAAVAAEREVGVAPEVAHDSTAARDAVAASTTASTSDSSPASSGRSSDGEIVADPFEPEMGVDRHHAAVGPQDPEQQPDGGRSVAQQHPHRRAARQRRALPVRRRRRRRSSPAPTIGTSRPRTRAPAPSGSSSRIAAIRRGRELAVTGSSVACGRSRSARSPRRRSGFRAGCTSGPAPSRRGTACRATPRSRAPSPAWPPSGTTR